MSDSVSISVDDSEDGRATRDAHISESRYGAPGFVAASVLAFDEVEGEGFRGVRRLRRRGRGLRRRRR